MSNKGKAGETKQAEEAPANTGRTPLRQLMLRHFMPPKEWVAANIMSKPVKTKVPVVRIYGVCTGVETRPTEDADGNVTELRVTKGVFHARDYLTKKEMDTSSVFFPSVLSKRLSDMIDAGAEMLEIDVDACLENNGKGSAWTITSYIDEDMMDPLTRLGAARKGA